MKYKEISVFTTEAGLDAVCARFSMLGMEQLEIVQGREEIADFLQKAQNIGTLRTWTSFARPNPA